MSSWSCGEKYFIPSIPIYYVLNYYGGFYINLTKLFPSLLAVPLETDLPPVYSALNDKNTIF